MHCQVEMDSWRAFWFASNQNTELCLRVQVLSLSFQLLWKRMFLPLSSLSERIIVITAPSSCWINYQQQRPSWDSLWKGRDGCQEGILHSGSTPTASQRLCPVVSGRTGLFALRDLCVCSSKIGTVTAAETIRLGACDSVTRLKGESAALECHVS